MKNKSDGGYAPSLILKTMKKLLFALIALCMSISANAQIYDSNNVHYYIRAGQSIGNATITIIVYDGNKGYKYIVRIINLRIGTNAHA